MFFVGKRSSQMKRMATPTTPDELQEHVFDLVNERLQHAFSSRGLWNVSLRKAGDTEALFSATVAETLAYDIALHFKPDIAHAYLLGAAGAAGANSIVVDALGSVDAVALDAVALDAVALDAVALDAVALNSGGFNLGGLNSGGLNLDGFDLDVRETAGVGAAVAEASAVGAAVADASGVAVFVTPVFSGFGPPVCVTVALATDSALAAIAVPVEAVPVEAVPAEAVPVEYVGPAEWSRSGSPSLEDLVNEIGSPSLAAALDKNAPTHSGASRAA